MSKGEEKQVTEDKGSSKRSQTEEDLEEALNYWWMCCHQCQRGRLLEMMSFMAKEITKEEHLKKQQGKESMKHEAEAVLEGLVDWRSGKAAETSEETEENEMAKGRAARERQGNKLKDQLNIWPRPGGFYS